MKSLQHFSIWMLFFAFAIPLSAQDDAAEFDFDGQPYMTGLASSMVGAHATMDHDSPDPVLIPGAGTTEMDIPVPSLIDSDSVWTPFFGVIEASCSVMGNNLSASINGEGTTKITENCRGSGALVSTVTGPHFEDFGFAWAASGMTGSADTYYDLRVSNYDQPGVDGALISAKFVFKVTSPGSADILNGKLSRTVGDSTLTATYSPGTVFPPTPEGWYITGEVQAGAAWGVTGAVVPFTPVFRPGKSFNYNTTIDLFIAPEDLEDATIPVHQKTLYYFFCKAGNLSPHPLQSTDSPTVENKVYVTGKLRD